MALSSQYEAALFWMRLSYAGSIWLVPIWAVVVSEITGRPLGKAATGGLFALFAVFAAAIPTESFIGTLSPKLSFRFYDDAPGPAFHAWGALYTAILLFTYTKLFLSIRSSSGVRRNQTAVFFLTGLLGFGGGMTTFPLVHDIPIYPFGVIAIALFPLATSYGILRHRLMDINLALYRFTVFMAYVLLFGLPLTLLLFLPASPWMAFVVVGVATALGPSVHGVIKARVTKFVENLPPFRGRYAHLRGLEAHNRRIAGARDAGVWAERLTAGVEGLFGAASSGVCLFDAGEKLYRPAGVGGHSYAAESELIALLKTERRMAVRELLLMDCPAPRAEAIDGEMRRAGAEIAVPMFAGEDLAAVLNIGPRADGRMYNEADVAALWGLVTAAEATLKAILMADELVRKERLATMGQVAAIVGHEIRNALTSMSHSAYLLEQTLPGQKARKHVDVITRQIASSQKIVGDILGFVRERRPALAPVDANAVVREAADSVARPRSVTLALALSRQAPKITVDPGELRQALVNLVQNAVEAMPEGGVVRVETAEAGGAFRVSVSDTGRGIPPEIIDRLFTPLFSTKPNGTGLGLLVVKTVAERHGGSVSVESAPGRGTTFHVLRPLRREGNGAGAAVDHSTAESLIENK